MTASVSEPLGTPVVRMRDVTIDFPGVKALDGVDFRLLPGEIHALMGENGAGKSTLIKALTGVYGIDSGSIVIEGVEQRFAGPRQAQDAGISTVYQEVNLCANLTVAENILLGREPRRFGRIDYRAMNEHARALLGELDLTIDPRSTLGDHPIALAATGRHRAGDGGIRTGADPRRTDVEPRRRRGGRAVPRDAPTA